MNTLSSIHRRSEQYTQKKLDKELREYQDKISKGQRADDLIVEYTAINLYRTQLKNLHAHKVVLEELNKARTALANHLTDLRSYTELFNKNLKLEEIKAKATMPQKQEEVKTEKTVDTYPNPFYTSPLTRSSSLIKKKHEEHHYESGYDHKSRPITILS